MNRVRPIIGTVSSEQIAQREKELEQKIETIQQQLINESLAQNFPAWDLNPPAILVRRKGKKFI
ncbi:MAG: hypothetical protein NAG76_04100 [Candidatus Pristimantibacillus lignocellulolyticus]|uniref:Uncharacterized protein n=1 Tax=Candidatus Pristimantibacillus lignocellulolyticus TaxID=2994561 RepID=A0A9J6ZGY4_9BACL|nr:MAG: hypothetical protein NAG76_04100 [Candidatus Pristimantibacillus lignocellulolyticus]